MVMISMASSPFSRAIRYGLSVGVVALALGACEPKVALRGNLPLDSQLEQVEVGRSNKSEVQRLIGSPSTVGTFDDDTWYYMSQRQEQWGFMEPEVTDHKVLVMYFDQNGVLDFMQKYTEDDLREIAYSDRVTPTSGRELSILEQLFGNFNRFRR